MEEEDERGSTCTMKEATPVIRFPCMHPMGEGEAQPIL